MSTSGKGLHLLRGAMPSVNETVGNAVPGVPTAEGGSSLPVCGHDAFASHPTERRGRRSLRLVFCRCPEESFGQAEKDRTFRCGPDCVMERDQARMGFRAAARTSFWA